MEEPDNFVVNGYVLDEMIERQIDCNSMASEVEGGGLACKKWVSKKGYLCTKEEPTSAQVSNLCGSLHSKDSTFNFRCTMDA